MLKTFVAQTFETSYALCVDITGQLSILFAPFEAHIPTKLRLTLQNHGRPLRCGLHLNRRILILIRIDHIKIEVLVVRPPETGSLAAVSARIIRPDIVNA